MKGIGFQQGEHVAEEEERIVQLFRAEDHPGDHDDEQEIQPVKQAGEECTARLVESGDLFEQDEEALKEQEELMKFFDSVCKVRPVGPDDPCPCGSGLSYRFCHGRHFS